MALITNSVRGESKLFSLTVEQAVERIRARNPELHTFVSTRLEEALGDAARLRAEPARSALHGVPFSLKDTWDTAGLRTTGGSHRFKDRVPKESSPVHSVFESAGAVLVGKTALSDFAMAPESASWVGGIARNPHDPSRTTGGSSGGAAAAVADGMSAFDWGSDIGGSIRLPAAYCGVFGLRLSSELWPLVGAFPEPPPALAWMNGQGPIASSVPQIRALLDIAAPRLRTGTPRPFRYRGTVVWAPKSRRRSLWPSFAEDVAALVREAGEVRTEHGLPPIGSVMPVYASLWGSHFDDLLGADPTLTFSEGLRATISAILFRGRFGDRRFYPSTAEIFALIALGSVTIFRDKKKALAGAEKLRAAVGALWDQGFLVALPVSMYPAPRHHRSILNPETLACTCPGNIVDATSLAIPCGRFPDGLPRAFQLMGPPGSEDAVLEVGERASMTWASQGRRSRGEGSGPVASAPHG